MPQALCLEYSPHSSLAASSSSETHPSVTSSQKPSVTAPTQPEFLMVVMGCTYRDTNPTLVSPIPYLFPHLGSFWQSHVFTLLCPQSLGQ